jgi:dihydroorotate dehydrogenase
LEAKPFFLSALQEALSFEDPRLSTTFGNLELKNPLGLAAGMAKKSDGLLFREALGFGYLTIGGITADAQP